MGFRDLRRSYRVAQSALAGERATQPWRHAEGFRIPGEFVVVKAAVAREEA